MTENKKPKEEQLSDNPTAINSEGASGAGETQKRKLDLFKERIGGMNPDRTFESDDDYFDEGISQFENMNNELGRKKEVEAKIMELIKGDPVFAAVLHDMMTEGSSFIVSLLKFYDPEELQAMENDPDYEEKTAAMQSRKEKLADLDAKSKEIDQNVEKASEVISGWSKEKGHTEEMTMEFLEWADELMADIAMGKIEPGTLDRLWKAWKYDEDIDSASKAGELKGKNANIEAKKEKATKAKGDGLPSLEGGSGQPSEGVKKKRTAGWLDEVKPTIQ